MEQPQNQDLIQYTGQDHEEIYSYIYELSKRDYRGTQVRIFARRSISVLVLMLSAAGVFFTAFYFLFLQNSIETLRKEILQYRGSMDVLNSEIARLEESETEYKQKLREYQDTFSKMKIENGHILDFDLSEEVQKNISSVDALESEYRNITRGNTTFREVALTFDLGTGEDLPYVTTIMKRFGVRATIFISNEMSSDSYGSLFSERNLLYLSKLSQIGCEFGNHTWSHYNLKYSLYETSKRKRLELSFISDNVLEEVAIEREFARVKDHFQRETGIELEPFWRAPYGAIDHRILVTAARAGYPNHVLWSANREGPLDFFDYVKKRMVWVKEKKTADLVLQRNPFYFSSQEMLTRLKRWEEIDPNGFNGAIAISHLGTGRKTDKIIHILPEFISHFQARGYHFVLVSELLNDVQDH